MDKTKFKVLDSMKDKRTNCYSIMLSMDGMDYLELIDSAYKETGGIEGQRQPLTTKSAMKIRATMKNDISEGTVLPPIVIGCVTDNLDIIDICLKNVEAESCKDKIHEILSNNTLSIIDGMQRTTALKELTIEKGPFCSPLRIELWITNTTNSLIYRMLILNTGQISWGLKKQLEVVFSHIKREIEKTIERIELIQSTDPSKSTRPRKYQLSHLVELYLSFSIRKYNLDLSEKVTEEFAKQDIIEKSYNQKHLDYFIGLLKHLVDLDEIFFEENGIDKRLFGDQFARIGFIVSVATKILGRPGKHLTDEQIENNYNEMDANLSKFVIELKEMPTDELINFYQQQELKDHTSPLTKKQLSEFYKMAFDVLVDEKFDITIIDTMEMCWSVL